MDIVDPCEGVASVGYLADTKEGTPFCYKSYSVARLNK